MRYIPVPWKPKVKLLMLTFCSATYLSPRQIYVKPCNSSHFKVLISCPTLNRFAAYFFQHILCVALTDIQLGWVFLYKLLGKQQQALGKCTSGKTWETNHQKERIFTFISSPASFFSFVYGGFHSWILSSLKKLVSFAIKYFFCAILLKQKHKWKEEERKSVSFFRYSFPALKHWTFSGILGDIFNCTKKKEDKMQSPHFGGELL